MAIDYEALKVIEDEVTTIVDKLDRFKLCLLYKHLHEGCDLRIAHVRDEIYRLTPRKANESKAR